MFIKTAKFKNEKERMESWQTDLVIQRKILRPSKRLIVCKQGVDNIKREQQKYEAFLRKFRPNYKKDKEKQEEKEYNDRVLKT